MTPIKPFTYLTWSSILRHLDPNIRRYLSKNPTIQRVEQHLPLQIESVEFDKFSIKVNNIRHWFGLSPRFIRFNVTNRKEEIIIHSYNHDEVLDYMLAKFFGGKWKSVRVGTIKYKQTAEETMHRLSKSGIRLNVRSFKITRNDITLLRSDMRPLSWIPTVVTQNSLPLKSVSFDYWHKIPEAVIDTAEMLILEQPYFIEFSKISNRRFHLKHWSFMDLWYQIYKMGERGEGLGKHWSSETMWSVSVKKIMDYFANMSTAEKTRVEGVRPCQDFPYCYTLPINELIEHNVFVEAIPTGTGLMYVANYRIDAKGTAKRL